MRLAELRRNPEQNKKETLFNSVMKYEGDDVFISFQREKKLGINPGTEHASTPLAIYSYYLPAVIADFKKYGKIEKSVPFASERPYVYIFKITDMTNVIDIETYTADDLKKDLKKLRPLITKVYKSYSEFIKYIKKALVTKYPFEVLNFAIMYLVDHDSIKMRNLFVKLGYYGVMDNLGQRATNSMNKIKESYFFSTKYIKIVDMFINFKSNPDDEGHYGGEVGNDPTFDPFDDGEEIGSAKEPAKKEKKEYIFVLIPGESPYKKLEIISQQEYDKYKDKGLKVTTMPTRNFFGL